MLAHAAPGCQFRSLYSDMRIWYKRSSVSHPHPADRASDDGVSLADLFRREVDLESFRRAVAELGGRFPFATADMIDLGRAYLERFPDREQDRNAEEVRLGYALVRTAIIEKAVLAVDPARRQAYRTIFGDLDRLGPETAALVAASGRETVLADHAALTGTLAGLKTAIEGIPKGMIRERFIGGISYFFNILYVFKLSLGERRPG
jgi:hypothetical protein